MILNFQNFSSFIVVISIFLFLTAPLYAADFQIVPEACTGENATDLEQCGLCQVLETGKNIFQYGLYLAATIAVFFLVIAGFRYVTAGSQEEISSAKEAMQKTIYGLLIIIVAWVLVNSIMYALGYGGEGATWYNFKC